MLEHYSGAEQDAIATELSGASGGAPHIKQALKDYHDLRLVITAGCK